MHSFHVARTLAEARWQNRSRCGTQARLFSRAGEIFAAHRLHHCQLPATASQLQLRVEGRTTEYGQRLFIGLMTLDPLLDRVVGPGVAVSVDPETGMVEDQLGETGVVGYIHSAPQENNAEISLGLEAWFYRSTFIPHLHLNGKTVVLPAFLIEPGQTLTALVGGELGQGTLPRLDHTELTLRPLADYGMANG